MQKMMLLGPIYRCRLRGFISDLVMDAAGKKHGVVRGERQNRLQPDQRWMVLWSSQRLTGAVGLPVMDEERRL
jgi:hypothetical protein